ASAEASASRSARSRRTSRRQCSRFQPNRRRKTAPSPGPTARASPGGGRTMTTETRPQKHSCRDCGQACHCWQKHYLVGPHDHPCSCPQSEADLAEAGQLVTFEIRQLLDSDEAVLLRRL